MLIPAEAIRPRPNLTCNLQVAGRWCFGPRGCVFEWMLRCCSLRPVVCGRDAVVEQLLFCLALVPRSWFSSHDQSTHLQPTRARGLAREQEKKKGREIAYYLSSFSYLFSDPILPQSPKPTLLPSSPPRTRSQRRFRGGGFRPPPAPSRGCFTLNRRVLRSPHRALDFPRPRPHPRRRSPKEPESAPHRPAHSLSPSPRPVCRLALLRLRLPHRRPGPLGQFWVWLHRYNASSTFGQHTPTKSINPPWLDDAQPVRIQNHRHPPLEMLAVVFSLA